MLRLTTLNPYLIEKFRPRRDFDSVLSLIISVEPGERTLCSHLVVHRFGPSLNRGPPSMSSHLPPLADCSEMVGLHYSVPPPGQETAIWKIRAAADQRNTRHPQRVLLAYTADSYWRKRAEFGSDQPEMVAFLIRNWAKELGGGLIKELWAWSGGKITDRVVMRLDRDSHRHADHSALSTTGNDRN